MASVNTLCKSVPNVKNTVIKNCNLYSDKNGVKHIRIQARPNKWHENDCPFFETDRITDGFDIFSGYLMTPAVLLPHTGILPSRLCIL